MKIGLLSDTHGFLDDKLFEFFEPVSEIWHAGDIGTMGVAQALEQYRPFRAVFGNIDDRQIRNKYPEHERFILEGVKVWMTHIGGYPPHYNASVKRMIYEDTPQLFICGHSHILKVMPDKNLPGLLHINPGAAGQQGFHKVRTAVRFDLNAGNIENLQVIELGKRGK